LRHRARLDFDCAKARVRDPRANPRPNRASAATISDRWSASRALSESSATVDSPAMSNLFSRRPLFIGVVHLAPTPGAPRFRGSFEAVIERASEDAAALRAGGCHALLVENYGDAPFFPRGVPPETVASLALCVRAVAQAAGGLPIGVNVLRNDARAALGVAAAAGAEFVRINVHNGTAVTDQGLLEGDAAVTLRERARLAPHVLLLCDAHVKHARPLGGGSLRDAVGDLVGRALADAVIVTGDATGCAPRVEDLEEARAAARGAPVLIGSGLDDRNAAALVPLADGAIVGTFLKRDGKIENPVDRERVARLARAMRDFARPVVSP
jgi:membrane complex biogenesis BtpA family protein